KALQDRGVRIPDDVSVVGFDDMPLASHVSPALTTMQQNAKFAAEGLVRGIVGLIEGKPVESTLMAPRLIVRRSCGSESS
ncbi:MAG: substrate-binding domain-containing protein, partial [Pseudomonadota bacterium]